MPEAGRQIQTGHRSWWSLFESLSSLQKKMTATFSFINWKQNKKQVKEKESFRDALERTELFVDSKREKKVRQRRQTKRHTHSHIDSQLVSSQADWPREKQQQQMKAVQGEGKVQREEKLLRELGVDRLGIFIPSKDRIFLPKRHRREKVEPSEKERRVWVSKQTHWPHQRDQLVKLS